MSQRVIFGKTWWGRRWVEAMERIDFDTNRLPRGRRYANGGMVRDIRIEDGKIFARVQGSRPRPYQIEIVLKRFTSQQIKTIRGLMQDHPVIASELLVGRLPEGMLDLLDRKKTPLLPASWSQIEAQCSCPDWANPCKHLAAVYYTIANEIDKDPLIVLALRGAKPSDIMEGMGTLSRGNASSDVADWVPYDTVVLPSAPTPSLSDIPLDLSFERLPIEALFSLLPDAPPFYVGGNFKRLLWQSYARVAEQIEAIEINESGPAFDETALYLLHTPDGDAFFVSPQNALPFLGKGKTYTNTMPIVSENRLIPVSKKGREIETTKVLDLFLSLPLQTGQGGSPSVRSLHVATSLSLALIRAASYIPEVISLGDGDFSVRYIPLIHDEKQRAAMNLLISIFPSHLIVQKKDQHVLPGTAGVHHLLSLIMTHIVHRFSGVEVQDKLCNVAFRGQPYLAERFEERQTARAMTDWLERLSVRKRQFSPAIRIESKKQGFTLNVDVENKQDPMRPLFPFSALFKVSKSLKKAEVVQAKSEVLRQIAVASEYLPSLKEVVHQKGLKAVPISSGVLVEFLTQAKSILDLLGIRVIIPKAFLNLLVPRPILRAELKGETVSFLSLDQLLDFSWQVAIGDETLSREAFFSLVKKSEGLVQFKDHYLLLKPEEVRTILEKLKKPLPALTSMETLRAALTGEINGVGFSPGEALQRALSRLTTTEEIAIPSTLQATLRPYQERGFRWLYTNAARGFGSCLADDMGLGKTIQVITLLLTLKQEGRLKESALVVCPTTLVGNWQKECERFAPSLKTVIYHGTERKWTPTFEDVVVTTYGTLKRDIKRFANRRWSVLVIDEAQNIKNPHTDQTQSIKQVQASAYIALSGTPVENRITDLWSIFDFIHRGYLGPLDRFRSGYAIPIEKYRDGTQVERLKKATAPFLLRRVKTDKTIISDLPDKLVAEAYCSLTPEQAALYQQVVETTLKKVESLDGIERRGIIFQLITHLKQICNHPVQYLKKGSPMKEQSGKAEQAISMIEKVIESGEKAIVFTQYREMGELLAEMLRHALSCDPLFFHGGLVRSKRDQMVQDFQSEGYRHPVMILSLKAGGSGLNLTAATHVVHYDLWWNPAVEAQATDRAYRIGQKSQVTVHRLITLGTFEEKIDEMIRAKRELADLTVATGEQWITELSNRQLREIFSFSSG